MKISEIKSEEVRNEAVRLCIESDFTRADNKLEALEQRIYKAFQWMKTPQGIDFWGKLRRDSINTPDLKLPNL